MMILGGWVGTRQNITKLMQMKMIVPKYIIYFLL